MSKTIAKCLVRLQDCVLKNNLRELQGIFTSPIKKFELYEYNTNGLPYKYAVLGHQKTEFLNALSMRYLAVPPLSRSYPYIAEHKRYDIIEYLNFKESSGLDKVYLSARYEALAYKGALEMSDDVNSVKNYITGDNNYNNSHEKISDEEVDQIIELFNLSHLTNKWINTLSNGQLRRARIAKSILNRPKMLIIDDPFLGLDPIQTQAVEKSLDKVVEKYKMSIVLGLRFQDKIPDWIDNVAEVGPLGLILNGPKDEVETQLSTQISDDEIPSQRNLTLREITNSSLPSDPYIKFNNASVIYKEKPVLQNFDWEIPRGSSWRILGENGTGKTTIIALITADHPQSWRLVISVNGEVRKSGSGVTFFDVNNRIGISSPELHSLVPSHLTMSEIIFNGLVKDVGNSNFLFKTTTSPNEKIQAILKEQRINEILEQYGNESFIDLSITLQKFTLFLRAIIKDPELIILDEAFSCMDDLQLMNLCHQILQKEFKDATILSIGHIEWELPHYDYVLKLVGDERRSIKLFKADTA